MCDHCGCAITTPDAHPHEHAHGHGHHHHPHPHDHPHPDAAREVEVRQSILSRNERLAERNRGYFQAHGLKVLNIMSSPGSGKTTLLEQTLARLEEGPRAGVLVGDLATDNDAKRLAAYGQPTLQITTGTACHLDAHMIHHALEELDVKGLDLLFIENVGNLVCPASFDLGESVRVVILSVTEGEDKPLKYPVIFHEADFVLITKCDLAQAVEFKRDQAIQHIQQVAPRAEIIELSAKTGEGMDIWMERVKS